MVHGRNQVRGEVFRTAHDRADHHAQNDRSNPATILPCGATCDDGNDEAHAQWWKCDGEERDRAFSGIPQFRKPTPRLYRLDNA